MSPAQVWIARTQVFDGRTAFEVGTARVLAHRFLTYLADDCTCAARVGRRTFCSQRAAVQDRSRSVALVVSRVVSIAAAVVARVQEPHVGRTTPRARPAV